MRLDIASLAAEVALLSGLTHCIPASPGLAYTTSSIRVGSATETLACQWLFIRLIPRPRKGRSPGTSGGVSGRTLGSGQGWPR